SAPFGPVGALDAIPTYRLAAGTALPGIPPLRRHWAGEVTEALRTAAPSFVLDLRSEAYVALGPVPSEVASAYVRVVTIGEDGATRALNHFNKHGKGTLVRRLAETRPRIATREALLAWAETAGVTLQDGAPGEIDLVV
ncbi:peroxide stress protein YaaA, partial [Microbacterium sp. MRS-1]|uniref:peroxide stress protein YaaA n=1 Tax=Microbacterium sp. MRS-1 TaxID=1451261 RepID=UPI000448AF91